MCMTPNLSTTLNRHFLRQVRQLRVFCRHKERGCGWEGVVCLGASCPVLSQEEQPTRIKVRETVSVSISTNSMQYVGTVCVGLPVAD